MEIIVKVKKEMRIFTYTKKITPLEMVSSKGSFEDLFRLKMRELTNELVDGIYKYEEEHHGDSD